MISYITETKKVWKIPVYVSQEKILPWLFKKCNM